MKFIFIVQCFIQLMYSFVCSYSSHFTHHLGIISFSVSQCISGTETWQRVNTGMPVKSPRFALFDLSEGKSYRFRVRCCNSAGVSESSESTGEITVGDKLGKRMPSAYSHYFQLRCLIFLQTFPNRAAPDSRQPSCHQEHRHLCGGLLGGL